MVQRVIIHINEQKKKQHGTIEKWKTITKKRKKNLDDDHDHHHHKVHHQHLIIIIIIIFDCHRKWIHRKITLFVCVCVCVCFKSQMESTHTINDKLTNTQRNIIIMYYMWEWKTISFLLFCLKKSDTLIKKKKNESKFHIKIRSRPV